MPQLPNAARAVIDLRKLEDYCLDFQHPRGRHKARVFREALGLGRGDAVWLRDTLTAALERTDASELADDRFGRRWRVDVAVERHSRQAVVRTIWIVRSGEDTPRFVTCWIL
jgi:hypothetical protein